MRTIEVGTSFSLTVAAPTATFLRIRPCDLNCSIGRMTVADQFGIELPTTTELDWCGGEAIDGRRVDRIVLPSGSNNVLYTATLEVSDLPDVMPAALSAPSSTDLRPEHWWWLQPSRYCRPDELGPEAWRRFGANITSERSATGSTVRDICSFVNDEMAFEPGSTTTSTSAAQAWIQRRGVCRDFNHIAASFCRALNIPTRYVFGYIPDLIGDSSELPMDFCAWIEVCLDDTWWTFDARVNEPRVGRIVVGRGRDAADVPLVSTLGPATIDAFAVRANETIHAFDYPSELTSR